MRFWNRATSPDSVASPRSRSTVRGVPPANLWGQRPLFSRPDEENDPHIGILTPELRLDHLVPIDESDGSQARSDLLESQVVDISSTPIVLGFSTDNVAIPPTDAQITTAFGSQSVGFVGILIDNGGIGTVFLVVKSELDSWWYEQFTKAT